jgi:hypothetical protein
MDEYQHRLERAKFKIDAALLALLFGGILILPGIGQLIWIACACFCEGERIVTTRSAASATRSGSPTHRGA